MWTVKISTYISISNNSENRQVNNLLIYFLAYYASPATKIRISYVIKLYRIHV